MVTNEITCDMFYWVIWWEKTDLKSLSERHFWIFNQVECQIQLLFTLTSAFLISLMKNPTFIITKLPLSPKNYLDKEIKKEEKKNMETCVKVSFFPTIVSPLLFLIGFLFIYSYFAMANILDSCTSRNIQHTFCQTTNKDKNKKRTPLYWG